MGITALDGESFTSEVLDRVLKALDSGSVVALPTETAYALIGDVSYTSAADRMFALTKRPRSFELSLFVADREQAESVVTGVTPAAEKLMEKCWPGPLTLVLPRDPEFVADLGSDEETVGLRSPGHLGARQLCEEVGPLATTAAARHGQPPLTTAREIEAAFGDGVAIILDGGEIVPRSPTVVDVTGTEPKLIRAGAVDWETVLASSS